MRVALLGYGKMNKLVAAMLEERGHRVACVVTGANRETMTTPAFTTADVVIDFSVPAAAVDNIEFCIAHHLPVVVGTTGWYDETERLRQLCNESGGTVLYGANFSIGVNIAFAAAKLMAGLNARFGDYRYQIKEVHHAAKLDKPSGTAIAFAGLIAGADDRYSGYYMTDGKEREDGSLAIPIESERTGDVPGTHRVIFTGPVDEIELVHNARNRKGFAAGAVAAAEWLQGKTGFFNVTEMFD